MSLLAAILPLAFLVLAMTIRWSRLRLPLAPHVALPLAAALAYGLRLLELDIGPRPGLAGVHARIIEGLLSSLTPLSIVFGAILLFTTLDRSGAMDVLIRWLRRLTPDPLLQVLLVGWAFSALVEGLSGFGTPAALAAPILVGLGFPAVRAAAACLVMNTIPVVFGAVGTPIWFGLGELDLTRPELLEIGQRAALVQLIAAPLVVAAALRLLFPWRAIRTRAASILGVVAATAGASFLVAHVGVEFPSIAGGLAGLAATILATRLAGGRRTSSPHRTGPARGDGKAAGGAGESDTAGEGARAGADDKRAAGKPPAAGSSPSIARAVTPLVATIVILAVTRLEALGLRDLLQSEAPAASLGLGPLGTLRISASAVVRLEDILGTGIHWSMALLFVPFILPFVVVAAASMPLLGVTREQRRETWRTTFSRLAHPAIALAGALVLVKLLMHGGDQAPVVLIGEAAAAGVERVSPQLWPAVAPLLGALGSFFSGSATVSNLTFAPVQATIASELGLDRLTVLAMQATGGAMGNMICIHNLVAVAAVLGLTGGARDEADADADVEAEAEAETEAEATADAEAETEEPAREPVGTMLRLTIGPMLVYAACAAAASFVL